jgi:hypothetical protein
MMEAVRTSETSVDNHFTRQYIPENNSEHHIRRRENFKSHIPVFCFHKPLFMYELGFLKQVLIPSQNISSLQSTTWKDADKHPRSDKSTKHRGASEVYCRAVVEIYDVQNVLLMFSCYFGIWYSFKVVVGTRSLNRKTYTTPRDGNTTILAEPDGLLMDMKNIDYKRVSNPHPATHLLSFCHM